MVVNTVRHFADELKMPAQVLLEQLRNAGVAMTSIDDEVTDAHKAKLLDSLRRANRSDDSKVITLTRRQSMENRQKDDPIRAHTIQVEVRKDRTFVKRAPMETLSENIQTREVHAVPSSELPEPPICQEIHMKSYESLHSKSEEQNMADAKHLVTLIREAFELALQDGLAQPVNLANFGPYLSKVDNSFSSKAYGYERLRPLLEDLPNVVQLDKDETVQPPRFFVRLLEGSNVEQPRISRELPESSKTIVDKSTVPPSSLYDFAYVLPERWLQLAELARSEEWGGKHFPLLRNYLNYTFLRLTHEKKIAFTHSKSLASFNTGLVDRRYQPIYALLVPNKNIDKQPWFVEGFCVAGEDREGKQLVTEFGSQLPESAYYLDNPADGVFDARAEIHVDWEHVIEENVLRIPVRLLKRFTTNFDVKEPEGLPEEEASTYKQYLTNYIKNNDDCNYQLLKAFENALDLARKKARWNYKTAIPIYYPKNNSMSMLLPLSLVSEYTVDLALVVERQPDGNYQGQTTYLMDWAYKCARLIARPESDWLIPPG